MKRAIFVLATATLVFMGVGVAGARVIGTPEIDQSLATFTVNPMGTPTMVPCLGEDGVNYVTESGKWKGTSVDSSPGSPDYSLNGSLTISAKFTVNTSTGTGVGTGSFTLKADDGSVAKGKFTVVNQIINANQDSNGRGLVDAPIKVNGNSTGTSLIANFEFFGDGTTGQISGQIGGPSSFGALDYSVEFNNQTCA
ncbi:MAG: hypothetical protein E6G44_05445 [Actinobacteria bacterium]|nr:MAG: hypothetical protein E6G44_05445 [Actinomycetota bacterium]